MNRILLPQIDPSIDRQAASNLSPANTLTLFYSEAHPGTYTMLIEAQFANEGGILLENIGRFASIQCSDTQLSVYFSDSRIVDIAMNWPSGTVLFTLMHGCNPTDERGVYVIETAERKGENQVQFDVKKSTLQDVVSELEISYGELVSGSDGSQMTSYSTTVTSYYTNPAGTLTSSTFLSTFTPTLTTMTLSSTSEAPTGTLTPLSPEAEAALQEMMKYLPEPGPDGTRSLPIKSDNPNIIPMQPLGSEPFNPDPAYQAALQAAMEADQLDPPESLMEEAATLLGNEEANVTPDGPAQLVVSDYAGTPDSVYENAPDVELTSSSGVVIRRTPASAAPPAPRAAVAPKDVAVSKRDASDTFWAVMGNDIVGEFCETCAALAGAKELFDAFKCWTGFGCPSPPQVTIEILEGTTTQEFNLDSSLSKGGKIFGDSKATVLCEQCFLKVSSFKIQGKVQVIAKQANYPENFVKSAFFTVSQNSVAGALFNIRINGAGSGNLDRALSTYVLDSLTVPSVFTISPRFIWGMGLTYSTEKAVDVQAGAVMTLNGAAADIDVKSKTASNSRNWQPSAQVTYPTIKEPGRLILTPYVKTDIQLSLTIFGQYIDNAAILTTQTNLGFDAEVLTSDQNLRKRLLSGDAKGLGKLTPDFDEEAGSIKKRSWFDNIRAAIERAQAAAGAIPKNTCNAGSMKLNTVMNTKNKAIVGGKGTDLINEDSRFGAQW